MRKFNRSLPVIFLSTMSVYSGLVALAAPAKPATPVSGVKATDVRLLEDPGANDKKEGEAIIASPKNEGRSVSKSEVAVSDEGTVEIHVNDASLIEVLRMLSLQSQKNIVCSKDVRGTVTANLYNVTIREALDQILHMNGYAYREKGSFINVYTAKELTALEEAEKKTATEVFRLHYTPAANALTMIKPVLSTAGQAAATTPAQAGIAAGGGETGGNNHAVEDMIVVTDFPDNLDKVRKILKEIDRRPQQVLVEATIIRAALAEDNALGVDFNVLAGVKLGQILTGNNGLITGANTGAASATAGSSGAGSIGTGSSFTSGVAGGLKVGIVTDNVSVFLAALEGVTDTHVLANPKVLALNKQKGEVIVGRKDGYLTTTVTESATVQTVEFLDTGTRLVFRPFVGDDGYVRMELHPEDSSGGLTAANLPFKITTEMTSNIMVKDGHTVVIGGLFRESSDVARSQVPGLGNLPLAGALFRNQRDRSNREEIIIMLTPHVIKDDSAYAKVSEEEAKRAEKLRVGTRRGMMPWGRERLAESAYEKAVEELARPNANNQKALWHLDCATNLNPKFVEAIELKQRVTGKEITGIDGSNIRGFVRKMILADKAPVAPVAPAKTSSEPTPAPKAEKQTAMATPSNYVPDSSWNPFLDDLDWYQPEADQLVKEMASPSTQPATASKPVSDKPVIKALEDSTPKVVVTELPLEEVKSGSEPTDQNK